MAEVSFRGILTVLHLNIVVNHVNFLLTDTCKVDTSLR